MWCIGKLTKEYRRRMYRILDLYSRNYNPQIPTICIDEKSKQLVSDKRPPLPMQKKKPQKIDYEYKRNGTRNIFVAVEPQAGTHTLKVTKTRKKEDFAVFVRGLVDGKYKHVQKLNIVLDNLNTHFEKSFVETFGEKEAERVLKKVEFYYTPKHASWLNMAEIEISMIEAECLGDRIGCEKSLMDGLKCWENEANRLNRKINWQFTKRDAFRKMSKHYVS